MSVVYALATPPAKSAICVFRVSGEGCLDALEGLFKKGPKEHGFFCVRDMYLNNEIILECKFKTWDCANIYAKENLYVFGYELLPINGKI